MTRYARKFLGINLFFLFCFFQPVKAQQLEEFDMMDTVVTVCKGILYDSNEDGDLYGNNEDFTFTINTGGVISLFFLGNFNLEDNFDFISFYDGPDVNSPQIGASITGSTAPGTIVATSGYLTVHFISDENVAREGWTSQWSTQVPPPVPPTISVNPVPACNSTTIDVTYSYPIACSAVDLGAYTFSGATAYNVISATPVNCTVDDSTTVARLEVDAPLDFNCDYGISFNISLPDRCDSLYEFTLLTNFTISSCPLEFDFVASDTITCPSICVDLEAEVKGCLNYTYVWSNGLPDSPGPHSICPNTSTWYSLTVLDQFSNQVTDSIYIEVIDPQIDQADGTICQSDSIGFLTATPIGGIWTGAGIQDTITGYFIPDSASEGTYDILYTIGGQCSDTLTYEIKPMDAGFDEAACPGSASFLVSGYLPPGGTWIGSFIQPNGLFDPSTIGVYDITYSFDGCSETKKVYVDNVASSPPIDTVCQSDFEFDLSLLPPGGRWSGTGIIDSIYGTFDPDEAEGGLHTITYDLNGCDQTLQIFVKEIQANASGNNSSCPEQPPFILNPSVIPTGGTWTGIGIIDGVTGEYDPSLVNSGTNGNDLVLYTHPNGCQDSIYMRVRFTRIADDTLHYCVDETNILLNNNSTGRTPGGGIWTGTAISNPWDDDYFFDPVTAGIGIYQHVYTKNTCLDSVVTIVYPNSLNASDTTVCSSQTPFVLDTSPPWGQWTGEGIVNSRTGLFDPSTANTGMHTIYYQTPTNCVDSIEVTVYQYQDASINNLIDEYCYVDTAIFIDYQPIDGLLTSNSIVDTIFNPSVFGAGSDTIILTHGTGVCFTSDTLVVSIYPELTTQIDVSEDTICGGGGSVINITATGGQPQSTYYYSWSNGAFPSSQAVVRPDVTTTYVAITSDQCSDPAIDSITIIVYPDFTVDFETSPLVCYGDPGYVIANLPIGDFTVEWGSPIIYIGDTLNDLSGVNYDVHIVNNLTECDYDTIVKIPGYGPVIALFSPNPNLECVSIDQSDITFIDLTKNATTGTWDFDNGNTQPYVVGENPSFNFQQADNYTINLYVENQGGCPDEYSMDICVLDENPLFIPDAFSPNGDGLNEILFVRGNAVEEIKFHVYNRWGEKVFETTSLNKGWDGTYRGMPQNTGVYVYYLDVLFMTGKRLTQKGDVSLIR